MSHPLQQTVRAIGRQARRLVAIHGLCRLVSVAIGAALALGAIDYLLRIQDTGLRIIFSVLLLAAVGWAAGRFLIRPLRKRFREVEVAQRIERRFPQLEDRLSS